MKNLNLLKVCKSYGKQQVLKNIDFECYSGTAHVIKGKSGSGKSTLINICSLIELCDSGEIEIFGNKTECLSDEEIRKFRREDIGYIFQDYNLFEELSVDENLDLFAFIATGNANNKDFINKKEEILYKINMDSKRKSKAKLLSGGERQRLAVARTLLFPKKIIFADEPSANIDNENVEIIIEIFKELLKNKVSLIISSHDDVFDTIADNKYKIENGVIIRE